LPGNLGEQGTGGGKWPVDSYTPKRRKKGKVAMPRPQKEVPGKVPAARKGTAFLMPQKGGEKKGEFP